MDLQSFLVLYGLMRGWDYVNFNCILYIRGSFSGEKMVNLKVALGHYTAKDILSKEHFTVSPDASIAKVLELSLKTSQQDFPVVASNKVVGILTRQNLISAIHQHSKEKTVKEVMSHKFISVKINEHLTTLYSKMAANNLKTALVFYHNELKGVISLEDIARVYNLEVNA